MSRIHSYARREPRVWGMVENSVDVWLVDRVWFERKRRLAGTDDGTPLYEKYVFGPYAGKLSLPVTQERFQADREQATHTHSLAVACDVMPHEQDTIIVADKTNKHVRFRVEGTVNPRPSAWGVVPIYQVDLVRVTEY